MKRKLRIKMYFYKKGNEYYFIEHNAQYHLYDIYWLKNGINETYPLHSLENFEYNKNYLNPKPVKTKCKAMSLIRKHYKGVKYEKKKGR